MNSLEPYEFNIQRKTSLSADKDINHSDFKMFLSMLMPPMYMNDQGPKQNHNLL